MTRNPALRDTHGMLLAMSRPVRWIVPAVAACLSVGAAGCGSSSSGPEAASLATTARPRVSNCPTPTPAATPATFPSGASSDLPRPAFATSPVAEPVQVHGVTLLRFTTAMPLRDAVAFVLREYPKAGYRLLQGDSEQDEADAPFVKGNLTGKTRLTGTAPCSTTWLVAVTKGNARLDDVPGLESHDKGSGAGTGD